MWCASKASAEARSERERRLLRDAPLRATLDAPANTDAGLSVVSVLPLRRVITTMLPEMPETTVVLSTASFTVATRSAFPEATESSEMAEILALSMGSFNVQYHSSTQSGPCVHAVDSRCAAFHWMLACIAMSLAPWELTRTSTDSVSPTFFAGKGKPYREPRSMSPSRGSRLGLTFCCAKAVWGTLPSPQ